MNGQLDPIALMRKINELESKIEALRTIETGGIWTAWTPTLTGWSSDPSLICRYTSVGKLCHCIVRNISVGTSNSTEITLTLPFTAGSSGRWYAFVSVYDNGAYLANPGLLAINENGTIATVYKDNTLAGFTASGNKVFRGEWFYEIA